MSNDVNNEEAKKAELLNKIYDKVTKLQTTKSKQGDFPTTQELNVPPMVADNYKKVSNSIAKKAQGDDTLKPGQKQEAKPTPVTVEVKQEAKPTPVAQSTPKSDPLGILNLIQASAKGPQKAFPDVPKSIPINPAPKVESKPTEAKSGDRTQKQIPTTPLPVDRKVLYPSTPNNPKPEFRDVQHTQTQESNKKLVDSVLQLVNTIKTTLVPTLEKKESTKTPVDAKSGLSPATPTTKKETTPEVQTKPLQPNQQLLLPTTPPQKTSIPSGVGGRLPTQPPIIPPPKGFRVPDPLPKPNNPSIGGLASKLSKFGADPALLGMVEKGKGQPDFNKYADPANEATKDIASFGGKFGGLLPGLKGMKEGATNTFEAERFGDIGAGMLNTAGSFTSVFPGGQYADPLFKFAAELMKSIETVRKWADNLHQANMQFAEFSASMAQVEAESEQRRIRLSQERGDRRAPMARKLAESRDKLDKRLALWEDRWANFKASLMIPLLEGVERAAEAVEQIKVKYVGEDADTVEFGTGKFSDPRLDPLDTNFEHYGRPSRFPRLPGDPR